MFEKKEHKCLWYQFCDKNIFISEILYLSRSMIRVKIYNLWESKVWVRLRKEGVCIYNDQTDYMLHMTSSIIVNKRSFCDIGKWDVSCV